MLRILFVYRVFAPQNKDPIVDAQAKSLLDHEKLAIKFLKINKPKIGYLIASVKLFFLTIIKRYDIIHFHHSYSGYISLFSFLLLLVAPFLNTHLTRVKFLVKNIFGINIQKKVQRRMVHQFTLF